MLHLHSNPGDYAWGQGGLDAVITEVSDVLHISYYSTVEFTHVIIKLKICCVTGS